MRFSTDKYIKIQSRYLSFQFFALSSQFCFVSDIVFMKICFTVVSVPQNDFEFEIDKWEINLKISDNI